MKDELNAYGRTIGEEIETKYIRSDELEIIKSSKLYEYVEDIYDKPTSSKFLKLTAYMALNILKGICSIVLPMAAIAFLVFLCSKMGAYSLGRVLSVNTFMTANDFVSIFFPLFKFAFVLCFLFSVLKLFAAFYFVKKK